jgi:hypothetical protein
MLEDASNLGLSSPGCTSIRPDLICGRDSGATRVGGPRDSCARDRYPDGPRRMFRNFAAIRPTR